MKRVSRLRLGRIGIVAALAVMLGTMAPALSGGASATAATDGQMVVPASGNIQSKVGDGCRGNYRAHDGIDISAPAGAPIVAAYDGVIKSRTSNSGYGNYTDIEHPGGYVTRYAHMPSPGIYAPGTKVSRGQQIGSIGNTGNSAAYHLHFEVRLNGSIYTAINGGFTCLSNVTRGAMIPLFLPGLGTGAASPIASADYTGDGKADLLSIAGNGDLQLRPGTGAGSFASASPLFGSFGAARRHLTHADFNGDGDADVLVARSDGVLEFYAGTGTGSFRPARTTGSGWYDLMHMTSGGDYSGDGKQDIVGVSQSGILTIYRGDGDGGFLSTHVKLGSGWQTFRFLVGGDFDNDGRGDLIAVKDTGDLYFYPGVPNSFGTPKLVGGGWMEFTEVTGGVDYNGDGLADLLGRTASGELYLYPGTGSGSFWGKYLVGADWADHLSLE